ncbi:endo alpha-1,4 polygalactosaminidase [Pseudoalteromonas sp. GB56]
MVKFAQTLYYIALLSFVPLLWAQTEDAHAPKSPSSIAFYYADIDSTRELLSYERVVVDPQHLSQIQLQQLKQAQTSVLAYLSVGEAPAKLAQKFDDAAIGFNDVWQATIMDNANPQWRAYLIQQAQHLKAQGYDGVFLDTLDSYQLVADITEQQEQRAQLISLVAQIQRELPVILNRGFDLYTHLPQQPIAIAAESLFHTYDYGNDVYKAQSPQDTQWLETKLNEIKASGIEVIVIDYLEANRQARIDAAKHISQLGFTPYVGDAMLSKFGVSTHYPYPRRVLTFYNSKVNLKKNSECHKFLATLIEYAGYVPQCVDIHDPDINNIDLTRYAGAVFWLSQASYHYAYTQDILSRSIETLPTTVMGELPEQPSLLQKMGVKADGTYLGEFTVQGADTLYPLPHAAPSQYVRYTATTNEVEELISLVDENGNKGVGAAKTPWGALWLEPLIVQELIGDRNRWPVDPFTRLMPLFGLPKIPAPDVTTESGLRIVTAHIDGDGFPSVAWIPSRPYAGESILNSVLRKSTLPHTVSVIEAEVGAKGLYPDISPQLEAIARKIFALDNVEVASHTFSHPFFWDPRVSAKEKLYGDSLPVPNYVLDYDTEVFGSVRYINEHLAPDDKKVSVFLWSGMANPTEEVISKTNQLGIYNVNGGNTYVLNDNYSVAQVYPHVNWYEDAVQVYAPVMNENLYTELWTENFNGFSRVTETFELLGAPHRLKPASIYYHMYSGVYPASLNALKEIYEWVDNHELTPLYLGEFAQRAHSLYETGLGKSIYDDAWYISSTGVRTARLPKNQTPSGLSSGIAGINSGPDGNYVTLTSPRSKLVVANNSTAFSGKPYLQKANAIVEHFSAQANIIEMTVLSHQALQATFANARDCAIKENGQATIATQEQGDSLQVSTKRKGRFALTLICSNIVGGDG